MSADKGLIIIAILETIRNILILLMIYCFYKVVMCQYRIWQLNKLDKMCEEYQELLARKEKCGE